nr:unnamed protein product [Haemonchus contortus]
MTQVQDLLSFAVGKAAGNYDMNVREAWLLGYAGRNISISILDDGIQRDHPDLVANYDPLASTDINDHDDDPTPQNNGENKHGTRCAGEVAAVAGNNYCGVGVAFKAKIGGVRMLDGKVSDGVEAASLSLNQDHIDIYSASWGPNDDGKSLDGPGPLAREAILRGIKYGRQGKGNIFVWASGNGGGKQDSCSADGYTTSVYTLSVSSATYDNRRPWYLEECPSSIAATYSSGRSSQPAIVSTDVPQGCTLRHTGTSASAPLAAGMIALALEANPDLTWRDMQHIVLRTANPRPLLGNPGWSRNGVGRMISNLFGYGLMDGGAIVKLAKIWRTLPEQLICTYQNQYKSSRSLRGRFRMNFTLTVNGCGSGTPILYLEHVQVHVTVKFEKRGDLKLTLYSPSGTRSVLLPPRPQDSSSHGLNDWPFLSVQQWGEDPYGTWILEVESVTNNPTASGTFYNWKLVLYGTEEPAQAGDTIHPHYSRRSNRMSAKKICDEDHDGSCPEPTHTVIRLATRNDALARKIAADNGMEVRGKPFLGSHYFLYPKDASHTRAMKREALKRLDSHPAVRWLSEQRPRRRTKRDYIHNVFQVDEVGKAKGNYDLNVREAWLLGYAGRNITVSILDDGIQRDHPDLAANYDPLASTDINDHDDDPTPQNNGENKHGTRCAGEVAAIAGNNLCGVGVAFKAKIGGVRMLDGDVSDSGEAASLSLNQDHIDIYSASWGPEDDGKTFDGPGPLTRKALYTGIKAGRRGKGNIFVWASGNGGLKSRFQKRGSLKFTLYSPSGTKSVLLPPRPKDNTSRGFRNWPFLSVQQWGEDPNGTWILEIASVSIDQLALGTFRGWELVLYGTAEPAQQGDAVHRRHQAKMYKEKFSWRSQPKPSTSKPSPIQKDSTAVTASEGT